MIENTLYNTFRAAMRLGPDAKSFGADKDSVVVSTESDEIIYSVTFNDSRMEQLGCAGLCQSDSRYDKAHIEQDISQLDLNEDNPAEDFVINMMIMDLHELAHWADDHHKNNEDYKDEGHSPRWNSFIVENVLSE